MINLMHLVLVIKFHPLPFTSKFKKKISATGFTKCVIIHHTSMI